MFRDLSEFAPRALEARPWPSSPNQASSAHPLLKTVARFCSIAWRIDEHREAREHHLVKASVSYPGRHGRSTALAPNRVPVAPKSQRDEPPSAAARRDTPPSRGHAIRAQDQDFIDDRRLDRQAELRRGEL